MKLLRLILHFYSFKAFSKHFNLNIHIQMPETCLIMKALLERLILEEVFCLPFYFFNLIFFLFNIVYISYNLLPNIITYGNYKPVVLAFIKT